MARFLAWLNKYGDSGLALLLAIGVGILTLADEPSIDETRKLFTEPDLPLPRAFTDRNVAEIVSKAIQAKNPYR